MGSPIYRRTLVSNGYTPTSPHIGMTSGIVHRLELKQLNLLYYYNYVIEST